ncbi:SRPBCC family protein [Streptomyces aurantiacus]|uniref:Actinorhodin polyketide synthase bifunctional cyclase/dehydratase n=1 Tax=Streptomyces aurantiacus TaxID=47760 RepID=A0A7G1PA22_9ACTN|nr:SRPBCC family protein [Streptomyces aurantiacus]BCL32533.1 actinorhodin polyketide synthase bifunctional cyclase/dehydratase [Streptomyces aurantiacus]
MVNSQAPVGESCVVDAPAEVVLGLIADPDPLHYLSPTIVYAERDTTGPAFPARDSVTVWTVTEDEQVWSRTQHRTLDSDGLRVAFEDTVESTLAGVHGAWVLRAVSADKTEIELTQDTSALTSPEAVARAEGARSDLLSTVAYAAGNRQELSDLVVDFRDPLFAAGSPEDAYKILYEADRWPERLAHVSRIDMTEDVPGIQFFDMDTTTSDGAPHTTRSVRICFPHSKIVYKQIGLPALLDAHTGHWLFTPTREGIVVESRHVAVIKPSALPVLGEGTTVEDARRYLRRVLSTNSMTNLRLAKEFAEEQSRA